MSELRWKLRLQCTHVIASDLPVTEGMEWCPDHGEWFRVMECWTFWDSEVDA